MLSRVAERIYWLARYLERAENTARLVNVYSALLLDLPVSAGLGWQTVLEITGGTDAFVASGRNDDEREMIACLLFDDGNPGALLNSLRQARENARTTRDIFPSEAWRAVNELYLTAREQLPRAVQPRQRSPAMADVVTRVQGITGMLAGTMSQGAGYQFLRLGRNLERADMTTRIIDVAAALLLSDRTDLERHNNALWMAVLRCLSAYQMYRQSVRRRVRGADVIDFLMADREFPRAVRHCLDEVGNGLVLLPRSEPALESLQKVLARFDGLDPGGLDNQALHQLIDQLQLEIGAIHEAVAATWFYREAAA